MNIIKMVKRNIPKQVEWSEAYQSYYSAGDEAEAFCPTCGEGHIEDDQKFCKECGQALAYPWDIKTSIYR